MKNLLLPIVVITALLGYNSVFIVPQWKSAVVFQFREINRSGLGPGLHFLIPFVNSVQMFEKRLMTLDQEPQRFLTREKKDVVVDFYVKWRITDDRLFYRSTTGDLARANTLLAQRINSALRDEFGERSVQEVVAADRGRMMDIVHNRLAELSSEFGIEAVDVRTMRIDLPEEVSESVYGRMRAERGRVAKDLRARGEEAAERIQAAADREREVILANAYRKAEVLRGEGDAEATDVYAEAYGRDKEFYNFYRSITAYRNSFSSGEDVLVLTPDSEFFQYFQNPVVDDDG